MTLATAKDLLLAAMEEGYAIAGFNVQTLEMVQAVVEAAEEERSPVFLQFNPGNLQHTGMGYAGAIGTAAARQAKVPMVVHLDHGVDFAQAFGALQAGFTSFMYDGTPFPLEKNVAVTQEVCQMAHAAGLSVEGEIGQMGGEEEGVFTAEGEGTLTDPDVALEYVRRTGVDALAIAVGNTHGMRAPGARLDLERIAAIRARVRVPLVIHGASGVPDEMVREAIARGVCKFNVATQLNQAFLRGFLEAVRPDQTNPRAALAAARDGVREAARSRIRAFGSSGRVS